MGSRSHLGRLEYGRQLDAEWSAQRPSGYCDVRSFQYNRCLDFREHGGNSIIFTPAATNPYSITVNAGLTLTFSGVGITNNSGVGQMLTNFGTIRFSNSATAADVSIFNEGGSTNF